MSKATARHVKAEIYDLTAQLVEISLADDQNFPIEQRFSGGTVITYANARPGRAVFANIPYPDFYAEQVRDRNYNLRMLDGGLVQMRYEFSRRDLKSARLAFLPSPDLLEFQNNAEMYLEDMLYVEAVDPRVVTVPLRFDFDTAAASELSHPVSHLTLGQYEHCRIAATSALMPTAFLGFVLRSFYHRPSADIPIPTGQHLFPRTITTAEANLVHIGVPGWS